MFDNALFISSESELDEILFVFTNETLIYA